MFWLLHIGNGGVQQILNLGDEGDNRTDKCNTLDNATKRQFCDNTS